VEAIDPVVSRHHGLLGTVIELRVWARSTRAASAVEQAAVEEIERLQRVFDVHDEGSDLRRRLAGASVSSPELDHVLEASRRWRERSGGAFDPAVGALVELWDTAAQRGQPPSTAAIERVLLAMRDPSDARSQPSNLNALAKGWIVDRAVERGLASEGAVGLTVNAGGDLCHRAPGPLTVGVEDPRRPYDNVPPLVRVQLRDAALATSGGSRRGWQIGDRWYSHVLDPRSGEPVDHIASASVIASDAATADVVATVLSVVPVDEGLAFVAGLDDVGCCIVTREGEVHRDDRWAVHELTP
jgi:thiamine biosynthesis lipoprotein